MKPTGNDQESPGGQEASATSSVSKWPWLKYVRFGILITLLGFVALIWRLGFMDESIDRWVNHNDDNRLGFTVTAYPKLSLPTHPTLRQRFVYGYQNLRFAWEYHTRDPKRVLIGAQPPVNWEMTALLDQSMWVSGTRYLIATGTRGEIRFGTTKSLNGSQWAVAVEQALQENGMAVIHVRPKLVQVVPKSQLQDYRKAKLVEDGDSASSDLQK
jgi:hypothetical protein